MSVQKKTRSRHCAPQPISGGQTGIKHSHPSLTSTLKRMSAWYVAHMCSQHFILTPCVFLCSSSVDLPSYPSNSTKCVTSTRALAPVELGFSSERVCSLVAISSARSLMSLFFLCKQRTFEGQGHVRATRYLYLCVGCLDTCALVHTECFHVCDVFKPLLGHLGHIFV